MPKIGFALPAYNEAGVLPDIMKVARRAEELGYDSVWVLDRLFWATQPKQRYSGTPDQPTWPRQFKTVGDPLTMLTAAAAVTEKLELGTSVLIFGHYQPVALARRLATLDAISGGRLKVGFGSGWSEDEHDAMGVDFHTRGKRADEFLDVLKGCLAEGPFSYDGQFFKVPEHVMLDPVQKPHMPIYLATFAPASMQRAAAKTNGWAPVNPMLPQLKEMHQGLRGMVAAAGGNPDEFKLILRANYALTPQPLDDRIPFIGSLEQIVEDYHTAVEAGADEIHFDPAGPDNDSTAAFYLQQMEIIKNALP